MKTHTIAALLGACAQAAQARAEIGQARAAGRHATRDCRAEAAATAR